jgi:carotenoid 1,2-hydratase
MIPAMPTLPLMQTPPNPDAWHQVKAPGGYEGWYFDAEDFTNDIRLIGFLGEGCQFKGPYERQFNHYQKHPTRYHPPLPPDFPGFEFFILRAGKLWSACRSQNADSLEAAPNRQIIRVGDNELICDPNSFQLKLSAVPYLSKRAENRISAEMTFHISGSSNRFPITPKTLTARHVWTTSPYCILEGQLTLGDEKITLRGQACMEHRYGTASIKSALKRGVSGRVLSKDRALLFHTIQPRDRKQPQEAQLLEVTESGLETLCESATTTWARLHAIPSRLVFKDDLKLKVPLQPYLSGMVLYQAEGITTKTTVCERLVY